MVKTMVSPIFDGKNHGFPIFDGKNHGFPIFDGKNPWVSGEDFPLKSN